jgi:hypothetical protein
MSRFRQVPNFRELKRRDHGYSEKNSLPIGQKRWTGSSASILAGIAPNGIGAPISTNTQCLMNFRIHHPHQMRMGARSVLIGLENGR